MDLPSSSPSTCMLASICPQMLQSILIDRHSRQTGQFPEFLYELQCCLSGFPVIDRPAVKLDDRYALGRELGDRIEAASAVERVPADHKVLVRGAQIVLVGAMLAVDEPDALRLDMTRMEMIWEQDYDYD